MMSNFDGQTSPQANTTSGPRIDTRAAANALKFFKIMAIVVGIGLLILVLEMILHYAFSNDALAWWPMPHGMLFVIYVLATANLGFKMRWQLPKIALVILAGCVPFLSFWVENKINAETQAQLAAQ